MSRSRKTSSSLPLVITLSGEDPDPLHEQLYNGMREAILMGRLAPGSRVPSSRTLASELKVSRNTVLTAYDRLMSEGYLSGAVGSGSFVTTTLPDILVQVTPPAGVSVPSAGQPPRLSRRVSAQIALPVGIPRLSIESRPFRTGVPSINDFPLELWARLAGRRYRTLDRSMLYHGDPAGYGPLRDEISRYLSVARGIRCSRRQILIVSSAQQALDIAAHICLDSGDQAWIEDPGYLGARAALVGAGAEIVPVPVDDQGVMVRHGESVAPRARLAYVSPSHQYPVGVTMSLARRLELLHWASREGAWILEDDYDSEYRYFGRPLTALQGLDSTGHVIYIGSFSKTVFPSLRLGYMVVPLAFVDQFTKARALGDQHAPPIDQAMMADFIAGGHFARHIRRMRALYAERREALIAALDRDLRTLITIAPSDTGMHLLGWLPPHINDLAVSAAAGLRRLEISPVSHCYLQPPARGGLILGYASLLPHEISAGVRNLAEVLSSAAGSPAVSRSH